MSSLLTGTVLRIERASIHDGDGLRTVVFLKGCPLVCVWCSTPESQLAEPQKGHSAEQCRRCGICVSSCPMGALFFDSGGKLCTGPTCQRCFHCVSRCPASAIKQYGYAMTVTELMTEISKDEVFFFHSGGGVTLSGGEPLNQSDFVFNVLQHCWEIGIHTAMETSFYSGFSRINPLLARLNRLYVDIKHMDPVAHRKLTGVSNAQILENLQQADRHPEMGELVIRVPLIPGVNDTADNMTALGRFCQKLSRFTALELLPYHTLGVSTYANLGLEYPLKALGIPVENRADECAEILLKHGLKTVLVAGKEVAVS